jgi:Nitrate/nitrite transporter
VSEPTTTQYRRTLAIVSIAHTYSHVSILALPPVFVFLRAEFGLSGTQLGLLVTLVSAGMLAQIPLGEVVDRVGAKWPLVAGQALTAVGMAITALAPTYGWLIIGALVVGVGQAPIHPANYALVATVAPRARLGRSFSVHTFGGYLGFAVGPLLIGAAAVTVGWRIGLGVVAVAGLLYALIIAGLLAPLYRSTLGGATVGPSEGVGTYSGAIVFLGVFFIVIAGAEKAVQAFTPLFVVDGLDAAVTTGSNALAVFFTMTAVFVLIGGPLADRRDPRWNIAMATVVTAGALAVAVEVAPTTAVAIMGVFAVAGAGFGLMFASRDRLVAQLSADDAVGRSFGFVFTADSLGGVIAPVALGVVIDLLSVSLAFALTAGTFICAGALALAQGRGLGVRVHQLAVGR